MKTYYRVLVYDGEGICVSTSEDTTSSKKLKEKVGNLKMSLKLFPRPGWYYKIMSYTISGKRKL